nr:hypothetical protein [Tanacetum cinerariifolium]
MILIPSPHRSLRTDLSSDKTISEELTDTVSPTPDTTSQGHSEPTSINTKVFPGSIAGMSRRPFGGNTLDLDLIWEENGQGKDCAKTVKNQSKPGNIGHEIERLHQKPDQRIFFFKNQVNKAKSQTITSSKAYLAISSKSNSMDKWKIKFKG